ncbi:unnamed protein product [Rhodiola kirilowii]
MQLASKHRSLARDRYSSNDVVQLVTNSRASSKRLCSIKRWTLASSETTQYREDFKRQYSR